MIGRHCTIRHVDLRQGLDRLEGHEGPVFAIFWWGAVPLGRRTYLPEQLPLDRETLIGLTAGFLSEQTLARFHGEGHARASREGRPLNRHRLDQVAATNRLIEPIDAIADPATLPADTLSVVVCTRDRCDALADCLTAIFAAASPPREVIVVDNSARGSALPIVERFPAASYVHEPAPGLSKARNAGIRASRGAIIAFTDDDVQVSPGWTAELVSAFADPRADAVTGLVLPAELDTPARLHFQIDMGGFGENFVPTLFDRRFYEEARPYGAPAWQIGAGANMAWRRNVFARIGLFDERLGAGASGCSEDSELWYRLIASGGACLYEPRAMVHHHHRADWAGFKRQMRSYAKGHASALFIQARRHGDRGNMVRMFGTLPSHFLRTFKDCLVQAGTTPRLAILSQEILGWLAGWQYLFRRHWLDRSGVPVLAEDSHG
jgi:GT2 family glycosyltransferase